MKIADYSNKLRDVAHAFDSFLAAYPELEDVFFAGIDIHHSPWLTIQHTPETATLIIRVLGADGWLTKSNPNNGLRLDWETTRCGCRITIFCAQPLPSSIPVLLPN